MMCDVFNERNDEYDWSRSLFIVEYAPIIINDFFVHYI